MPTADERLFGVREKIKRAKKHVDDLERAMQEFRDRKPYKPVMEDDPNTGDKVLRIRMREDTPSDFALIVGDALHNLRTALDYLAWQLVEANGGTPTKHTYFPICDKAATYKTAALSKIKGMSAGAAGLIEACQPYQAGYRELWLLHELDIRDKHKLLIVTAFGAVAVAMGFTTASLARGKQRFQFGGGMPWGVQPDGTIPTAIDGAEVGRFLAPTTSEDDMNFDATFEVTFGDSQIAKGQPVVPLLTQCSQLVHRVVNKFIPFL